MKWEVTLKHPDGPIKARNFVIGGRIVGPFHKEVVETPERLQAGTIAQRQAKSKGILGYYVSDIKEKK